MLFLLLNLFFFVPENISLSSTHYFIMKIQNKRDLQQISFNHSADIEFEDFINLTKNVTQRKTIFLFMIDTTLASNNPVCFRKNILERILKLIMIIDDKIINKKTTIQYYQKGCKNISIIIRRN